MAGIKGIHRQKESYLIALITRWVILPSTIVGLWGVGGGYDICDLGPLQENK
jgi:hypothetical protein